MEKRIIWIWHATFRDDGVLNNDPNPGITDAFRKKYFFDRDQIIVRHSLYRNGPTTVTRVVVNQVMAEKRYFSGRLPDPLRYITEIIFNVLIVARYGRGATFFCIDPLSAAVPVLFRKIGYVKKVIFMTPDFARRRFNNPVLNKIYFLLDSFCTRNADVNVCNSAHVIKYKQELYKDPNISFFHMPNIPPPWIVEKYKNLPKIPHRIIYVGNLGKDINIGGFKNLFQAIDELSKKYLDISLVVVGEGEMRKTLQQMAEGKPQIKFTNALQYEAALEEIAQSEIGIALYSGENTYDEFRDSLKIREYQAFEVIPITTMSALANLEEIQQYKGGMIMPALNSKNLIDTISALYEQKELFISVREKAFLMYEAYENKYFKLKEVLI